MVATAVCRVPVLSLFRASGFGREKGCCVAWTEPWHLLTHTSIPHPSPPPHTRNRPWATTRRPPCTTRPCPSRAPPPPSPPAASSSSAAWGTHDRTCQHQTVHNLSSVPLTTVRVSYMRAWTDEQSFAHTHHIYHSPPPPLSHSNHASPPQHIHNVHTCTHPYTRTSHPSIDASPVSFKPPTSAAPNEPDEPLHMLDLLTLTVRARLLDVSQ